MFKFQTTLLQVKVWFQNRRMKWRHYEDSSKKSFDNDLNNPAVKTEERHEYGDEDSDNEESEHNYNESYTSLSSNENK